MEEWEGLGWKRERVWDGRVGGAGMDGEASRNLGYLPQNI